MIYYRHPDTGMVFSYASQEERYAFGEPGLLLMTEQEVSDHISQPPTPPSPLQQIEALEREHMLPKATRKFMLSFMEATAIQQGAGQGLTPEQSLAALTAGNPGYAAVKSLDNQIEALAALL